MMRSLYSAVSGLIGNQQAMDVIGNNIANVNTIGFKKGRAVFQDMMSQSLSTGKQPSDGMGGINPRQVGLGSYLVAVDNIFTAGTPKTTGRPNDLAIKDDGQAFFVVRGSDLQNYYTRAGDFNYDRNGYLVTPSGNRVQGWMSDPKTGELVTTTTPEDIHVSSSHKVMQARATSKIDYTGNLSTQSTASKAILQALRTNAPGNQSIFSVKGLGGEKLGLAENDTGVTVKAHATGATNLSECFNRDGKALNLVYGSGHIKFDFTTLPLTMTYGNSDTVNNVFSTLDDIVTIVNSHLQQTGVGGANTQMVLENGTFKLIPKGGGAPIDDFNIKSITSSNNFIEDFFKPLSGTYSGQSDKVTKEINFQKKLSPKTDFTTLSDFSQAVQSSISGSVIQGNDFQVNYLQNNFGLKNGDKVKLDIADGTPSSAVEFTYVDRTANQDQKEFNTVKDLADLIRRNSNHRFDTKVEMGRIIVTSLDDANSHSISLLEPTGSSYLDSILSGTKSIAPRTSYEYPAIEGKGRINYSMNSNNFRLKNEENVSMNIAGNLATFKFVSGVADTSQNEFNTVQELADLIKDKSGGSFDTTVDNNRIVITNTNAAAQSISLTTDTSSTYFNNIFKTVTPPMNEIIVPAAGGRVALNPMNPQSLTGFKVTNGKHNEVFDKTVMNSKDVYDFNTKGAFSSYQFFVPATESTKLIDLFAKDGISCNFTEDYTSIDFSASVDKSALDTENFAVRNNTTLLDMMKGIEAYLKLGTDYNDKDNYTIDADGVITIQGEFGQKNNIDFLRLTGYPEYLMHNFDVIGAAHVTAASGGHMTTNTVIHDEQGNAHPVKIEFSMLNKAKNEWVMNVSTNEENTKIEIDGAITNELGIQFNPDGTINYLYDRYSNPIRIFTNPTLTLTSKNGTNPVSGIKLNLGTSGTTDGIICNSSKGSLVNNTDGYPMGTLKQTLFNEAGQIQATYSNDQKLIIGQLALATFANNQGLEKVGDTLFSTTGNSGQPNIGTALSGDKGGIYTSTLENANLDLSTEFVDLIVTQRAFQSNSRVITTSDEMIQELLTLKR